MESLKRLWLALMVACVTVQAGDISPGYTFASGEKNITHTKLNSVVGSATIQTSFFSGKQAKTTVDLADVFLLYDVAAGGYRKIEGRYLFAENPELVSSQTSFGTEIPLGGDYLLAYDTSLTANRKLTLAWMGAHWTNWLANPANFTEPPAGDYNGPMWAFGWNSAANAWYKLSLTNVALKFWQQATTNATALTAGDYDDVLPIWDTSANLTKKITVKELLYGSAASTTLNDTNLVAMASEGGHKAVSLGSIKTHVQAATPDEVTGNTSSQTSLAANEQTYTWAHTLSGVPHFLRCVLVCTTTDMGYEVNDEVDLTAFVRSGVDTPCFTVSSDGTNVVVHQITTPRVHNEESTTAALIDPSKWKLKIYAALFN